MIKRIVYIVRFSLCVVLFFFSYATFAQRPIVVAKDGTGNFTSIQDALNSLPDTATTMRTIFIKKGVYQEKIYITGDFISIIGEDVANTQIVYSEARDIFRCTFNDDWGVATLNIKGRDINLENLTVINNYGFEAKYDVQVPCPIVSDSATKIVKTTGHQMAMRSFETTRMSVRNCVFKALGGDTVSPWNKEDGMFYFKDCVMEGGVDFYCPRGWALAEDCIFICHKSDAAIWHDGSAHQSSKSVLINCTFIGDDGFKLGRYHRDAQMYLINCAFPANMADVDIFQKEANPPNVIQWGRRVYYYNCIKEGGNYAWHANNLPDTLGYNDINPSWVFDYKWNPHKDTSSFSVDSILVTLVDKDDAVADAMLLYQRKNGGWPKHFKGDKVDYKRNLSNWDLEELTQGYQEGIDATIDNEATTKEIKYLVKVYKTSKNEKYFQAAKRGIEYLLNAQYDNGGWPQFYPDASSYRGHITYNDYAMVNVLNILQDIVEGKNDFDVFDNKIKEKCITAVQKGITCILKTQVKQKNVLTAWCAQHDEYTLKPAAARKFELISLSGSESVGLVRFLMRMKNPTPQIITSIKSAMEWFDKVKVAGYNYIEIKNDKLPKGKDKLLVKDESATVWARFYDINSNKPFVCGRDGVPKSALEDIEHERRIGYAWYGVWPLKLVTKDYPEWLKKWDIKN